MLIIEQINKVLIDVKDLYFGCIKEDSLWGILGTTAETGDDLIILGSYKDHEKYCRALSQLVLHFPFDESPFCMPEDD